MTRTAERRSMPIARERGFAPPPYELRLNSNEMEALAAEAGRLYEFCARLEDQERIAGLTGTAFLIGDFRRTAQYLAHAFVGMNRDVSPGLLVVTREDALVVEDGKIVNTRKTSRFHIGFGDNMGITITEGDVFEWFSRLFYTNIADMDERRAKQGELLDLFHKYRVINIGMDNQTYDARHQTRVSG